MAIVQEGATIGLGVSLLGRLHGVLAPGAQVNVSGLTLSGALQRPFQIKNVRMLTPTRVRIDFERPVNNDLALADLSNYSIQNATGSVALKILSIDIPNEHPAHFVTLNVTPATGGTGNYILSVNSGTLTLGPELMIDGTMEATGTAAWTPDNATISKQTGDPGAVGGHQVLQVVDVAAGIGDAQQSHDLLIGAYRVSGLVRSTDGLAAPFLDILPSSGPPTTIFNGTTATTWTSFQKDFSLTVSGMSEVRLGVTEITGHPIAQFDNISLRKWISSREGAELITAADDETPVDSTPKLFDGLGTVPQILAAIATSPTSGRLVFNESMLEGGAILNSAAYAFDLGLVFSKTDGLNGATLDFITGVQGEGELYHLTLNGVFLDNFLNPLVVPATTPFLGFISKLPPEKRLNLIIYNFLLKALRIEDAKKESFFLRRYLDGPQTIWDSIVDTIYQIPNLWSAIDAPDYALPFQKRIVGWTRELDAITNPLSPPVLRRLIASSVAFWKERGPEGAIEDILTLVTEARCYVVNWFDLRAVIDEVQLGEDHIGNDLWLLENAEDGGIDPYTYDVRIMDDGTLDRTLVRNLVRLTRPVGERVNILYLAFLDQFESDGDNAQWSIGVGTVADGVYHLIPGDGLASVPTLGALDWNNYVSTWKIRGTHTFRLFFYVVGVGDYYCLEVGLQSGGNANTLKLFKAVAGIETVIGVVNVFTAFGVHLYDNTFYAIRIEVTNGGTDVNALRVYLDAEQVLGVEDSDQAQGTIGFRSLSGFVDLSEVEVLFLPVQSEFVDINS